MTPAITALKKAGVPHRVLAYDADPAHPGGYGKEAAAALGLPEDLVCKTLLADLDDGRTAVAVVPVAGQLDLKALAAALGAKRAQMAEVARAERLTGYVVGGISPLGQRKRLPTVVDASVVDAAEVYVSGGRRGVDIGLAPADLVRLTGAVVAAIGTR
jgi:Cys-tRNA(Pro)/Cys-tRNA(Cys) deacylase